MTPTEPAHAMPYPHCPLPWKEEHGSIYSAPIAGGCTMEVTPCRVLDVRGYGHLRYRLDGEELQRGNARLVVEAVNSYAVMRAALESIATTTPGAHTRTAYEMQDIARKALSHPHA